MTENEAVERMAAEIHDATGTRFSRCWSELDEGERAPWRRAARAALTSHPAVDALRDLMRRLDEHFGGPDRSEDWIEQANARTVLENLPKEK